MITDKKNLPNSRVKLTITVSAEIFRHGFATELKEIAKDVKIEGFRPGKAPEAQIIAKIGRQQIEAGALDRALNEAYYEGLKEQNIIPVEGPNVEITTFTAPSEATLATEAVATFTAEVDILPIIELKNYKKMKLKVPKLEEVKEADVEEVVQYLLKQRSTLKEAGKDVVVVKGIWADIAFDGSVGGVKREDMKSEHHPLVVGEGQLIPGFEDAMMGLKVGEEKTFTVTFPKEYHASELAGKKAEFTVKINELKELLLPELDRDFTQPLGFDTVELFKNSIKENLVDERKQRQKQELEDKAVEELIKLTKFDVPQSMVYQEVERVKVDTKAQVERMGMTWDQYLEQMGRKIEDVEKEMHEQAEKNVRIGLALGKVVQEEKIEDRDNGMKLAVEKLVEYATAA
jgi:trigger factor